MELYDSEKKVLANAELGIQTPFGEEGKIDSAEGSMWDLSRTIRSKFLFQLCAHPLTEWTVHSRGIHVRGARISGELNFEGASLNRALAFRDCYFEKPLTLAQAQAPSISLHRCYLPSLDAHQLETRGDVRLNASVVLGGVLLAGARIGGVLDCRDAELYAKAFPPDPNVPEEVGVGGFALSANGAKISGNAIFSGGFQARGPVALASAEIGGGLDFRNATLLRRPTSVRQDMALFAEGVDVGGTVFLSKEFEAEGEVRLVGAKIGRQLNCEAGTFNNPRGTALALDFAQITAGVFLTDGFNARGEVLLTAARVDGPLVCSGGTFKKPEDPEGFALDLDDTNVTGNVLLGKKFCAVGAVSLQGVQISGQVRCSGGTLVNHRGPVLTVDGGSIARGLFLNDGFKARGEVRLFGTEIGIQLDCTNGIFSNPNGVALNAGGMKVNGAFVWRPAKRPEGMVDLVDANVRGFFDSISTWPAPGSLSADGFLYQAIDSDATPKERIEWLRRQRQYSPQPFENAVMVYRSQGEDEAARAIAVAKQKERRRRGGLGLWAKIWNRLLGATVGHGYRPWFALFWLAGLWLLGVMLFAFGAGNAALISKEGAPRFVSPVYVLDLLVPLVDFRQSDYWLPNTSKPWGLPYMIYLWVAVAAGWILTTGVVAAMTGLLKKD